MSSTCMLILATVFALAAVAKLRALGAFEAVLRSLVAKTIVPVIARAIPLIELTLAALLFAGIVPKLACVFATALLALFSVILLHMWRKRLGGCGCFGESADSPNIVTALTRNALLMLAALVVLTDSHPHAPLSADASTIAAEITIVIGTLCAWSLATALLRSVTSLQRAI